MRRTRAYFIKARTSVLLSIGEAGYIDAALFSLMHHMRSAVVPKAGSIYHVVLKPTALQLIPAYSSQSSRSG